MRYGFLAFGLMLLLVFFVPIYYTTGYCCGHEYDEGMTIAKHLLLGHDSCLVLDRDIWVGWFYIMVFFVALLSIINSIEEKKEGEER